MENMDILVLKAQKGDKDAFGQLYKIYFQRIYRYCKVNCFYQDALAQDLCQETFIKAWKALPTFTLEKGGTFQAFLFKIARNLIIDLSRKKKSINIQDLEEIPDEHDPVEELDRKNRIDEVRTALSKLKDFDRQIIILRYFEDLSHHEVAKIIGIKEGALRVRTIRLLDKIKEILKKL